MFFEYGKQHWYLRHNWLTLQRGLSAIAELVSLGNVITAAYNPGETGEL